MLRKCTNPLLCQSCEKCTFCIQLTLDVITQCLMKRSAGSLESVLKFEIYKIENCKNSFYPPPPPPPRFLQHTIHTVHIWHLALLVVLFSFFLKLVHSWYFLFSQSYSAFLFDLTVLWKFTIINKLSLIFAKKGRKPSKCRLGLVIKFSTVQQSVRHCKKKINIVRIKYIGHIHTYRYLNPVQKMLQLLYFCVQYNRTTFIFIFSSFN